MTFIEFILLVIFFAAIFKVATAIISVIGNSAWAIVVLFLFYDGYHNFENLKWLLSKFK